jgi:polyisoprenoid-binding protein YceI
MQRAVVVMVAAGAVAASSCLAGEWEVDPVHSSVGFSIRHMMVSNVKGSFTNFSGTVQYDPANPGGFAVEGRVAAASLDTGNAARDKHVRSPDFLDVEQYPAITFKSKELKKLDADRYEVTGDLGLHGVTNAVTLQLAGLGAPVTFNKQTRIGFSLTGQIQRDKFGIKFNKTLDSGGALVGNEVQLSGDFELVAKTAPAKPQAP